MHLESEVQTMAADSPRPMLSGARLADRDGESTADWLLEALLAEAVRMRASHIHIDPNGDGADLRLRVGGQIVDAGGLTRREYRELLGLVLANAGIEPESARPQRGSLRSDAGEVVVATLPVARGERAVLKLDETRAGDRAFEALGLASALAAELRRTLGGGGLVLVAGPARSGRSTTLRTLLAHTASKSRRALAVESDPGPALPGVCQAQARDAAAMGEIVRAATHQDFDILLVDAIADRGPATAAVEAVQDGRLVLAALDAPNAVGAIARLRDWRIEPFQLASSLSLVLGQRRVKRLCPECREPVQAQGSVSALLGFDPGAIVYAPYGCAACGETGFAGETGVFEAIRADAAIRRLINDGGDEAILASHAFVRSPNLGSAARALVRAGVTTPDEAVRISRS